jgi:hypothetical protein
MNEMWAIAHKPGFLFYSALRAYHSIDALLPRSSGLVGVTYVKAVFKTPVSKIQY